jgi:hypothetical protein
MDAACVMAGNEEGPQVLIKRSVPEAMWTHSATHCESLAAKELRPELSEMMDTVVKSVNYSYIMSRPLKNNFLQNYARERGHSTSLSCLNVMKTPRVVRRRGCHIF